MNLRKELFKDKPIEFKKGMRVRYIPLHTGGDITHSDCENGVVSSVITDTVFVKYDTFFMKMVTGDEPFTAQATSRTYLICL